MTESDLMFVQEVADRYHVQVRTARKIMNEAGAFKVGGKLAISTGRLLAWEDEEASKRFPHARKPTLLPRRAVRPAPTSPIRSPSEGPDWWR
jgi:hypothetical protein